MAGEACDVLIIGGGPAGLRAAEVTSSAGWRTAVADRMPSVGRKFLVAGRGGLNLTHSEPLERFIARYRDDERWPGLLAEFSPSDLRAWAGALGIGTFVGTSGRVFPSTKQAAPLLRRWVGRLRSQGVDFRLRHAWTGWRRMSQGCEVSFTTPRGPVIFAAQTVILAMGGGSWPQTGSDGAWVSMLHGTGVTTAPLTPANGGHEVAWPEEFLTEAEGLPLKNIVVRAGEESVAGELLITRYGVEGGALYQLGRALRALSQPTITLDLKPTFSEAQLSAKLEGTLSIGAVAKKWKLGPGAEALFRLHAPFRSAGEMAALAKAYPLALRGPRPLAEAISSAGGVAWAELNEHLMLSRLAGVFCAGEMIDWEAPTGGYLLQGCFATATRAARGVDAFLRARLRPAG